LEAAFGTHWSCECCVSHVILLSWQMSDAPCGCQGCGNNTTGLIKKKEAIRRPPLLGYG
jgi:hypothetical protein